MRLYWTTAYWRSLGVNRVVVALSVARLGDAMGNSLLFIVIPLYVARLQGLRLPVEVVVGLLVGLYGIVNSALQPLTGALSDRLGRRKPLIIAGLVLMCLSTYGFTFTHAFWDLALLRAAQGLGIALTVPAAMAIMASATERSTRGGAMGFYTTMRLIGFSAGPLIGGYLLVHFGFDSTFLAGAILLALAAILVQWWVPEMRVPPAPPGLRPPFRVFDAALLSPGVLGAALASFLMASSFSMVTTLENEFNARLHITAFGFGIAFSALMVGRLVSQVPLGRLSDHIGRRPLILAGLIATAPVTIALGLAAPLGQLIALRVAQGIAAAAIAAPAFAVVGDLSKRGGEARQMSIVTTGFGLGIALGPMAAGVLALHSFELPFAVIGSLNLVGAWVVYRYLPETIERRARAA
jgi:MFS family permease